jgi:hypothetical protein
MIGMGDKIFTAQTSSGKVQNEIKELLNLWNTAGKNANLDQATSMSDNSPDIMITGSADGEVYKGKVEIKKWLGDLFGLAG